MCTYHRKAVIFEMSLYMGRTILDNLIYCMKVRRMNDIETLKNKWAKVRESREVDNFDYDLIEPGKFCLHMRDVGGAPPCWMTVETTGFFDNARDALSYYRFAEIPRILHWDRRFTEDKIEDAEFYLSKYDDTKKRSIEELLRLIDNTLISVNIAKERLVEIQEKYNDFFSKTDPENLILAWGSLGEILRSSCFDMGFKEDMEEEREEDSEDDPNNESSTVLKKLLDTCVFDENNDEHLELGAIFLERRLNC